MVLLSLLPIGFQINHIHASEPPPADPRPRRATQPAQVFDGQRVTPPELVFGKLVATFATHDRIL